MNFKSNKSTIKVRILGDGIAPDTVRASDLADFIGNIDRAVVETAIAKGLITAHAATSDAFVSLVDIDLGSDLLIFALAPECVPVASSLTHAIATAEFGGVPAQAQEALYGISKQASKNRWSVEFAPDKKLKIEHAIISEHSPIPPPRVITATGGTTIYGRLMRIGGMKPKAMILLPDDNLLYIDMDEAMAKELEARGRLFNDVGIEGEATWRVDTWQLLSFKASRVTAYQPESVNPVQTFERLAKTASGRWDDIDAVDFVNNARSRSGK